MRARFRTICWRIFIVCGIVFAISLGINFHMILSSKNRVFDKIANLPQREIELVLGTEPVRPDGSVNQHFLNRTDAAANVFLAGKATSVLISGNKNNRGFNEVLEMQDRILAKGVPQSAIKLDFNGNRTLESVRRAGEIYHLKKVILITDAFHAPRSIFLCKHFGIDAIAYCPGRDTFGYWSVHYSVKEYFARLKAVFDIIAAKIN